MENEFDTNISATSEKLILSYGRTHVKFDKLITSVRSISILHDHVVECNIWNASNKSSLDVLITKTERKTRAREHGLEIPPPLPRVFYYKEHLSHTPQGCEGGRVRLSFTVRVLRRKNLVCIELINTTYKKNIYIGHNMIEFT